MLLELNKVKKYYGDRLILDIDRLTIYSNDRIGIVGRNGVGKTTLLELIAGTILPEEGHIHRLGTIAYVSQLQQPKSDTISPYWASQFQIPTTYSETMSGGEKTRFKVAQTLEKKPDLMLLDEPTSNLDLDGIRIVEKALKHYPGAIVIISHDRQLLDAVCTEIIEIDQATLHHYKGNYADYLNQKERILKQQYKDYESYVKEKRRLRQVMQRTKEHKEGIRKTPKRMGNSEARRLKMSSQKATGSLDRFIKSVEKRLERLERKEKPFEHKPIQFDLNYTKPLQSKIIFEAKDIQLSFGNKVIFKHASFMLRNGKKVALIGPNGSGKSTLIKMIINGHPSIKRSPAVNVGYFSQTFEQLDEHKTVIENVMETSVYPEPFVRILLARLLFRGDTIHKPVAVLSGGERVKALFAKLLVQDCNCLILDEPTNYLDIESIEALEEALIAYPQTILIATHDRELINAFANELWVIENHEIKSFPGNLTTYEKEQKNKKTSKERLTQLEILRLETKLSEIIGKLSNPTKDDDIELLNETYDKIMTQLRKLKSKKHNS